MPDKERARILSHYFGLRVEISGTHSFQVMDVEDNYDFDVSFLTNEEAYELAVTDLEETWDDYLPALSNHLDEAQAADFFDIRKWAEMCVNTELHDYGHLGNRLSSQDGECTKIRDMNMFLI